MIRGQIIVTQEPSAPNRNQVTDRETAIQTGTLDTIRDNVKGYVKAL
jgi:hypothetical protein